MRYPKQNSVIRLKSNIFHPQNFGLAAPLVHVDFDSQTWIRRKIMTTFASVCVCSTDGKRWCVAQSLQLVRTVRSCQQILKNWSRTRLLTNSLTLQTRLAAGKNWPLAFKTPRKRLKPLKPKLQAWKKQNCAFRVKWKTWWLIWRNRMQRLQLWTRSKEALTKYTFLPLVTNAFQP